MLTIVIPTTGHPDQTKAVYSVLEQTVPTKYILQEDTDREGAGPTRNKAIEKVETEWVGFCDDDDTLDEHYHEWLVKESPGYDVVIFKMKNQPNGGVPYSTDPNKLKYNELGMSFALKTSIAQVYPFNNMIGEDFDLVQRLLEAGYKIKVSKHIAYYVKGKDGTN